MPTFTLRPEALRERHRSLIDVELDPAQQTAVRQPPGGAMLVLGEAGHGKTTVALHRLAHLYRSQQGRFRAVVIVPHVGLERLLQPLVTRLGADVSVQAYERWARRQARRAFPDIPRRESTQATSRVARTKRHVALTSLLVELAALPPGRIDDDYDAPATDTSAHAQRGDLQHLFGDGDRMRRLAELAGFSASMVAEVLEHTHVQFLERSEQAYAHVDRERLIALDAQTLDEGSPVENAASIDTEDYAVLFELDRLRARRAGLRPTRPGAFDCIVLDEAQEFAPLELALIGRSLVRGGSLVVAGDADQQTDPAAGFSSWQATLRALRAPEFETVSLDIGYRCPPNVVQFARSLRQVTPPAAAVPAQRFRDEAQLASWLVREAARIEEADPSASFCVITRGHALARRLSEALRTRVASKLVLDGEFVFHRGVDITTLPNVKGLEFDYVVVADATHSDYPATPEARRALYVAATRARFQLALACVGEPSPLAPCMEPAALTS